MNLHKKIRFLYLKIRSFLYGYCSYDFDGTESSDEFTNINTTIMFTQFAEYLFSLFAVIGILLLLLSVILSMIFQNIHIFSITFLLLFGLFDFILIIIKITAMMLELFLGSILKLIEGYNKYFGKDK